MDIYSNSTSSWTQQRYLPSTTGSQLGTSVTLSGDGNTLAVGAPKYDSGEGAAFIYTRSGTPDDPSQLFYLGSPRGLRF